MKEYYYNNYCLYCFNGHFGIIAYYSGRYEGGIIAYYSGRYEGGIIAYHSGGYEGVIVQTTLYKATYSTWCYSTVHSRTKPYLHQ